MSTEFICVPSKTIIGMNGLPSDVKGFRIAERPVTVEEFLAFCQATGYRATAEQSDGYHFADNDILEEVGWEEYRRLPAPFMSLRDADAYCSFHDVRLPTDSEWLAASVVDWSRTYKGKDRVQAARQAMASGGMIRDIGLEWVLNEATSVRHLRSAPKYVLPEDWISRCQPLEAVPEFVAHTSCFRVVKGEKGE